MTLNTIKPTIEQVSLTLVDDPVLPSRSTMDSERLDELCESINRLGFISTIVVVKVGDRYEVIAGHRRTIAAKRCQLVTIPAIVYPEKTAALDAIKFAENRHREDLKPDEEAIWFNELLEGTCDGDTEKLGALLGEKRDYVEGRLALLYGDREVFQALAEGAIGVGIAQQLNRCSEEKHRRYLLVQAVTCGATVAMVASWIHQWKVLHQFVDGQTSAAGAAAAPPPLPPVNHFTCRVCELTEHPERMRPKQVHDYCEHAVLIPALAFFQRRHDYIERPTTDRDALALIRQFMEWFPSLSEDAAATTEP